MENLKHTKGEWEIHGTAVFSNGKLVANCVSDGIHFTEEDKANAKLIAAAPELLEALIYAKECLDKLTVNTGDHGDQAYQVIDNAINKATK